jgi:hypothetical protein
LGSIDKNVKGHEHFLGESRKKKKWSPRGRGVEGKKHEVDIHVEGNWIGNLGIDWSDVMPE